MNTEDKTNQIANFFSELHKNLHSKIKPYEGILKSFEDDNKKGFEESKNFFME